MKTALKGKVFSGKLFGGNVLLASCLGLIASNPGMVLVFTVLVFGSAGARPCRGFDDRDLRLSCFSRLSCYSRLSWICAAMSFLVALILTALLFQQQPLNCVAIVF